MLDVNTACNPVPSNNRTCHVISKTKKKDRKETVNENKISCDVIKSSSYYVHVSVFYVQCWYNFQFVAQDETYLFVKSNLIFVPFIKLA